VLRLYVRIRGVSFVSAGVLGGVQDGPLDIKSARFRIATTEDEDQVLPAERLRHEFPSLAGLGVAAEGGFHQRRRVELGFHGFHQILGGVLRAAQARLFFFNFADLTVDLWREDSGRELKNFWRRLDWRSSRTSAGWMSMGRENLTTDDADLADFH
jgi:hypothetical protein